MPASTVMESARRSVRLHRRAKPSELRRLLDAATGRERAELMEIISRHDAWDEVDTPRR
jgi:hypothetical protein